MRRRSPAAALALWAVLLVAAPGVAGAQGITTEQADAILSELRQIRQLLERWPGPGAGNPGAAGPETASVPAGGAPALGSETAPVTLVEFTDYECPFCRQFHAATFERLKQAFIDTGRVRFVSRDLPLDMHPHAFVAAEAARCAGDQGKYWEARHALMTADLSPDAIGTVLAAAGVDPARLQACLEGHTHRAAVREDSVVAQAAGITGTPTFVLGRTTPERIEGVLILGAQPYAVFEARIKAMIESGP